MEWMSEDFASKISNRAVITGETSDIQALALVEIAAQLAQLNRSLIELLKAADIVTDHIENLE